MICSEDRRSYQSFSVDLMVLNYKFSKSETIFMTSMQLKGPGSDRNLKHFSELVLERLSNSVSDY